MEILIGAAAGIAAAAVCVSFYLKGKRDGMKRREAEVAAPGERGEDKGGELMRKYELIMGYDPYEAAGKRETYKSGYGEGL
ncbi:MAG: hypothetical protein ACM3S4_07340 [Burkholderiales bacterium]